jgi:hypothetical protein
LSGSPLPIQRIALTFTAGYFTHVFYQQPFSSTVIGLYGPCLVGTHWARQLVVIAQLENGVADIYIDFYWKLSAGSPRARIIYLPKNKTDLQSNLSNQGNEKRRNLL